MKNHSLPAVLIGIILLLGLAVAARAKVTSDIAGSIVSFGRYEQDGNEENGPEPIEWIVLDVQDGKALLLSRYGLDHMPYHTADEKITWEGCTLREWLNSDFLRTAFTSEEQDIIPETKVDNSSSQCFGRWNKAKGGNDTLDQVFLLSFAEANRWLGVSWYGNGSDNAQMELTEYAGRDAHRRIPRSEEEDGRTYWHWWLRSPGAEQADASDVTTSGCLVTSGVTSDFPFVRPAIWLELCGIGK